MKKYTLLLDESGGFQEYANVTPSMVGGILLPRERPDTQWAANILQRTKGKREEYKDIKIRPFHAKEETSPYKNDFITDALAEVVGDGACLVMFDNREGHKIVNSDVTYLNIFADGVLMLIRELLSENDGPIHLDILYSHRQEDKQRESLEKTGRSAYVSDWTQYRIKPQEYKVRVRERMEILMAKLPVADQQRISRNVKMEPDSATTNPLLMLADAACWALRGGRRDFEENLLNRMDAWPHIRYVVPEKETWSALQDCFTQNHYAEAVYLWYGGYGDDLAAEKEKFHEQLVACFKGEDAFERENATDILSRYLQQLINQRHFEIAERLISRLDTDYIPLMRTRNINFERLYFDIHFFRLTIATHQGDYIAETREIALCREALKRMPSTYETLDYYLSYKLREVEHFKNCYDFHTALRELEKLEKILTEMVAWIREIDDLHDYADKMTSSTLGKVYGSRIMTRYFLGVTEPEQFSMAREDFSEAIKQFTNKKDRSRVFQSRAAIEYWDGRPETSLAFLSLCFCGHDDADAQQILAAIKSEGDVYGLMHYASLAARAGLAEHPLGRAMFEAWQKKPIDFPDRKEGDKYPISIILWRLATCAALFGTKSVKIAANGYERAITASMKNTTAYANIAAGLVMQLERLTFPSFGEAKNIARLQSDYKAFMASDIPDAMRQYFAPWKNKLAELSRENLASYRKDLREMAEHLPIL